MIIKKTILVFITLTTFIQPSFAISLISGDNVIITHETGDVVVSGGKITILAPINGDIIAAGGEININSPVSGDVIASGGQVVISSNVEGKVLVAGGDVRVDGEVEKFVLMAGGNVGIGKNAKLHNDVFVAGGQITNNGIIEGNLTAFGGSYTGNGKVTGNVYFKKAELFPPYFFDIITAGFLILGLLLVSVFPEIFQSSYKKIAESYRNAIVSLAVGGIGIIIFLLLGIILTFTLIGTATGIFLILSTIFLVIISNLVVSYSVGKVIIQRRTENRYASMLIGFAILYILTKIPHAGGVVLLVSTFIGSGALLLLVWDQARKSTQTLP